MIIKSKRIKRFLYNLGFEFSVINTNGKEEYSFPESSQLKESIDFYYKIRKTFNNSYL